MAWPTNKPDSNKFSSDNSSIKESRPELNTMSQAVNDIVDYVDTAAEANGYILQYNSGTGKLEYVPNTNAIDINGGAGITVDQESTGGFNIAFSGSYTASANTTYDFLTNGVFDITSSASVPRINSLTTNAGIVISSDIANRGSIAIIGGSNGNITLEPHGTGKVRFNNAYSFPNSDGSSSQVLQTNGAGQLSFATISGLTNPLTADLNVGGFKITDTTSVKLEAPEIHIQASAGTPVLEFQGTDNLIQTTSGGQKIRLNDTGSKLHFYSTNAISINDLYTLPVADGTSGQVLTTNGAGTVSFQTPSGGAGITDINAGTNMAVSSPDSAGGVEVAMSTTWNNPINVNDQVLSNAGLKGYSETVYTAGATTGTLTPAVSDGNVQTITLTGNITINALSSPATGDSVTMIIRQPSSGGPYTLSSTMKFAGGTKTLSTGANEIDVLSIFYDGTDYLASLSTNFS